MVDIRQEGRGKTQGARTRPRGQGLGLGTRRAEGTGTQLARAESEAGTAEGRRRAAPGGVSPSSSWLPEPLWRGRHGAQAQPSPLSCGTPEGWNRAQQATLHMEQPGA